jgi:D-glycero-D-manno-heptose 1,7-bisphosphate phosphatase
MTQIYWGQGQDPSALKVATKCVIGIDRDGTINEDLGTYVTNRKDFRPIENSLQAIAMIRNKGHKIAIITNQGGIAKGAMTQEDVDDVHSYMFDLLGQAGCPSIDALYYSASSHKDDEFAKPNVGMFKRCEKENPHIKFKQGFYVGDKLSDLKAAVKIGARPILVRTGYGSKTEEELQKFTYQKLKKQTYIFNNLWEFAQAL